MGKKLRIGGPALGPGQLTWIWDRNDTRAQAHGPDEYGQTHLRHGDEIDFERAANGQDLVDRGLATIVDTDAAAPPVAPEPLPIPEQKPKKN